MGLFECFVQARIYRAVQAPYVLFRTHERNALDLSDMASGQFQLNRTHLPLLCPFAYAPEKRLNELNS
jgi:hypothetical protein